MRRLKKSIFKGGAAGIVLLLAIVRCAFPEIAQDSNQDTAFMPDSLMVVIDSTAIEAHEDTALVAEVAAVDDSETKEDIAEPVIVFPTTSRPSGPIGALGEAPVFVDSAGNRLKHKIYSVSSYREAFPDLQDVQMASAVYWGVRPVEDREQAEHRMNELVFVGSNPYYVMDSRMRTSIPYLVPRAADLLQTIARNFLDSLAIKQIPAHKIIVSSVLRTEADVRSLRKGNVNASENSCHRFGTTFDISYRNFCTVAPPGEHRREVRNDSLKFVLSEVLNDLRLANRCCVKHEVKQPCFHITVR